MIKDLLKAYSWITVVEANSRRLDSILRAFRLLYPSDATSTQYSGRGQFSSASKLFARLVTRRGRLIGFSDPWKFNAAVFDTVIPFTMRRAMRLLECDALEALGIEPTIQEITLRSKEDTGVVDRLGLTKHRYLILNLFSGSTKRGLSLEYQINLTRALQENIDREKKIILTGSAADAPILAQIKEVVPGVMLAPALSLQDLIVLVEQSGGVVSLDTGVGHIAAQVGAPLVILRTCWGYQWWTKDQYPRDDIQVFSREDLCASGHTNKDFPDCLNEISTEDVATAAQKYFKL
jgi:ADP-heptose:LPS heptosyltransferase